MIDEVERFVGIDNVGAWHLNDSKKPLGSRVDRHEHIGKGEIGLEAFRHVLNDKRFRKIPKVIETPKPVEHVSDRENLAALRSLIERPPVRRVTRARAARIATA
jgi:deoxyribonuclease-4